MLERFRSPAEPPELATEPEELIRLNAQVTCSCGARCDLDELYVCEKCGKTCCVNCVPCTPLGELMFEVRGCENCFSSLALTILHKLQKGAKQDE